MHIFDYFLPFYSSEMMNIGILIDNEAQNEVLKLLFLADQQSEIPTKPTNGIWQLLLKENRRKC